MSVAAVRARGPRLARTVVGVGTATAALVVTPFPPAQGTPIGAASNARQPVAAPSDPRAVRLLTDASRAARTTGYSGTQYVSAWGDGGAASVVVKVEHYPGRGTAIHVQASAAGPGGEVFEAERPGLPVPFDPLAVASVESGPLDLLQRNYEIALAGADLVSGAAGVDGAAGEQADDEVVARRPDGSVAARFWVDQESRLAVRREVYDVDGALVRATAYVDLRLGTPAPVAAMDATAPSLEERLDAAAVTELRRQGWVVRPSLPAGMQLVDVRRQGTGKSTVLHLSYTDGLSSVSVFIQHGRLDTRHFAAWRRTAMGGRVYVRDDGLARHVTWSGHGRVYTVIADAPPRVLAAMVAQLPHGEKHRGWWGRLEHGLERLGSWLDPFD